VGSAGATESAASTSCAIRQGRSASPSAFAAFVRKRFMDAAEVVVRDIQCDSCNVVVQLLAKAVGQRSKPARTPYGAKVLASTIVVETVLIGITRYYVTAYSYTAAWRVPALALPLRDALQSSLYDHAMRTLLAEGVADRSR